MVPFVWSTGFIAVILLRRLATSRLTAPLVVVAVAGPLLAYIALAQYGHASPLFMLIGLGVQCIALLVATVRTFMPTNPTPHADARDVPAPASGSGARAGGRER
jgi:hypothetical protein